MIGSSFLVVTFPDAPLEYALAGLPIICTDVGDCGKVISNEDLGWLDPPKQPKLLAEAMKSLIDCNAKNIRIGQNIKKKVEEEYGKKSFLKSYYDLLKIKS